MTKLRLVGLTKKEATKSVTGAAEEATRGLWLTREALRYTATGKRGSYQHCMTTEDVQLRSFLLLLLLLMVRLHRVLQPCTDRTHRGIHAQSSNDIVLLIDNFNNFNSSHPDVLQLDRGVGFSLHCR